MVHFDFRKLDVFSFGENQNCLVGSVDLLYRNSWNECVRCTSTASNR
ncbi:class I adenylate cyclase [Escherichia coli]